MQERLNLYQEGPVEDVKPADNCHFIFIENTESICKNTHEHL